MERKGSISSIKIGFGAEAETGLQRRGRKIIAA